MQINIPIKQTSIATSSSSPNAIQQQVRKTIDNNTLVITEVMNSAYESEMEIAENLAPSEEEIELRKKRKEDNLKKARERKEMEQELLEEERLEKMVDDMARENIV